MNNHITTVFVDKTVQFKGVWMHRVNICCEHGGVAWVTLYTRWQFWKVTSLFEDKNTFLPVIIFQEKKKGEEMKGRSDGLIVCLQGTFLVFIYFFSQERISHITHSLKLSRHECCTLSCWSDNCDYSCCLNHKVLGGLFRLSQLASGWFCYLTQEERSHGLCEVCDRTALRWFFFFSLCFSVTIRVVFCACSSEDTDGLLVELVAWRRLR